LTTANLHARRIPQDIVSLNDPADAGDCNQMKLVLFFSPSGIIGEAMSDAELAALMTLPQSSRFPSAGALAIERRIGQGQFSVVYRARARDDGRIVALKKVHLVDMLDAKARIDCIKETNLLQVKIFSNTLNP